MSVASAPRMRRVRVRVEGTVQGVGFRPYVHRLAAELSLSGHVLNDERGVLIEIEGDPAAVERFMARLPGEAPPLAAVARITGEALSPTAEAGFRIAESARAQEPWALVSPDAATCPDCIGELFDPRDRRFRYPFINCTNCGPRFTIVRGVPYDRPLTTMAGFEMCSRCRAEYDDPEDRRFHAQPNACPDCGPSARLLDPDGEAGRADGGDAIAAAANLLLAGAIVAVKGLGGYHLACRADDERAVAALRSRKRREDRPFALMAPSLAAAATLIEIDPEVEPLLLGRERPIVIAPRLARAQVAASVAPRSRELGVMLPYSPLHHLLVADAGTTLVMTSGNVSDEPIVYRDGDAPERLRGIADAFLVHDRGIETRTDDSVVRAAAGGSGAIVLRRSRGYVPANVDLPLATPHPVLACGAELKSTFCVAKGGRAWVGHHIGDLKNYETLRSFAEGAEHFERLFGVEPEVIAHDLHPDYLSTSYALSREVAAHVAVQHHHAHLAACLAEHGETGPAVGAIFDGTGYGSDGTVWGGELLFGDLEGFERAGHLFPVRMPGGDQAIRAPWRMACAWLVEALGTESPPLPPGLRGRVDTRAWNNVASMARTGFASPVTTSMGRLFDAVAAICGIRASINYEGQAAAELEARAAGCEDPAPYPMPRANGVLDARETIGAVVGELESGVAVELVAGRFHAAVANATALAVVEAAGSRKTDTVVLSGGVFQNRVLLERTAAAIAGVGLRVLVPRRLPPNDGGVSYGQAAVVAARLATGKERLT